MYLESGLLGYLTCPVNYIYPNLSKIENPPGIHSRKYMEKIYYGSSCLLKKVVKVWTGLWPWPWPYPTDTGSDTCDTDG